MLENILVGGVLLAIVAAIIGKGVWKLRHHRGGGCSGCGGSCSGCSGCGGHVPAPRKDPAAP